jgi:hypothetical protein
MRATTVPQPPTTTIKATPGATATFLVATDRGDDPASTVTLELGAAAGPGGRRPGGAV